MTRQISRGHLDKRQIFSLYIRKDFLEVFKTFQKMVEKDDNIKQQRNKPNDGLVSIALCMFISEYVRKKILEENEESNGQDNEEQDSQEVDEEEINNETQTID